MELRSREPEPCSECGASSVRLPGQPIARCRSCRVRFIIGLYPPTRIPGHQSATRTSTLTEAGFQRGYAVLASRYRMPTNADAMIGYQKGVGNLSDVEFLDSCRAAIAELDRSPTARWLVGWAVSRRRPDPVGTLDEGASPYAGHWSFTCHGCGYSFIQSHVSHSAPELCSKCARTAKPEPVYEEVAW